MEMKISIPDTAWWAATAELERRGTSIREQVRLLLFEAATAKEERSNKPKKQSLRQVDQQERREQILDLVRQGHDDGTISQMLDTTRTAIAAIRQRAGIPANPGRR